MGKRNSRSIEGYPFGGLGWRTAPHPDQLSLLDSPEEPAASEPPAGVPAEPVEDGEDWHEWFVKLPT